MKVQLYEVPQVGQVAVHYTREDGWPKMPTAWKPVGSPVSGDNRKVVDRQARESFGQSVLNLLPAAG